jgi:dTDP-4-dehydrorhamnose 3,5-epimerase
MNFSIEEAPLQGLLIVRGKRYSDNRGFFSETFKQSVFREIGLPEIFAQDNLSVSGYGVIRGIHFQSPPHVQGKFVSVLQGKVRDVAVDLRKNSPDYGKHFHIDLTEDEPVFFYVPPGFGHAFSVLSERCIFSYKCTGEYHGPSDGGIHWNDPDLNIDWGLEKSAAILSEKDNNLPFLSNFATPFI